MSGHESERTLKYRYTDCRGSGGRRARRCPGISAVENTQAASGVEPLKSRRLRPGVVAHISTIVTVSPLFRRTLVNTPVLHNAVRMAFCLSLRAIHKHRYNSLTRPPRNCRSLGHCPWHDGPGPRSRGELLRDGFSVHFPRPSDQNDAVTTTFLQHLSGKWPL